MAITNANEPRGPPRLPPPSPPPPPPSDGRRRPTTVNEPTSRVLSLSLSLFPNTRPLPVLACLSPRLFHQCPTATKRQMDAVFYSKAKQSIPPGSFSSPPLFPKASQIHHYYYHPSFLLRLLLTSLGWPRAIAVKIISALGTMKGVQKPKQTRTHTQETFFFLPPFIFFFFFFSRYIALLGGFKNRMYARPPFSLLFSFLAGRERPLRVSSSKYIWEREEGEKRKIARTLYKRHSSNARLPLPPSSSSSASSH